MPAKILVVDDFQASADMLALVMELQGFDVRHVYSGEDALAVVRDFVPDIVLSDLNMPFIPGYGLCQMLKADPRLASTLFIAQTADSSPASLSATKAVGFDYHLVKPIDVGVLGAIIEQHLASAPQQASAV